MKKLIFLLTLFFLLFGIPKLSFAAANSYVNIVNPIRGNDFWELSNQNPVDAVKGQIEILRKSNTSATWLVRYDALKDQGISQSLKQTGAGDEKGLFLEITPTLTQDAGVQYRKSQFWHFAESVLLTGYDVDERQKLIDIAFEGFKKEFGEYPKSVGAWWIDGKSLEYMQQKYGIVGVLIVADQYSTDNYQIWGQYWSSPYYPNRQNALYPAQEAEQKLPVVMMQWAARDPVNGYGKGVEESTYSVQANDYIDYHDLDINYFSKLVDIYTTQKQNQFGEIVVGLENSYDWQKYKSEYERQIETVKAKQNAGQLQIVTMAQFANWHLAKFPNLSPQISIIAGDPLGSNRKVVWFMNTFYRAGWFSNNQGSVFRDVRQYSPGEKEPCLEVSCKAVNFATFKTRSLDEVTFGDKYIVDPGSLSDFKANNLNEGMQFSYQSGAGKVREVKFLPRDIEIDGRVWSIDAFILEAKQQAGKGAEKISLNDPVNPKLLSSYTNLGGQLLLFLVFLIFSIFIPGLVICSVVSEDNRLAKLFLSLIAGIVIFTFAALLAGLLKSYWLLFGYDLLFLWLFLHHKMYEQLRELLKFELLLQNLMLCGLILAGVTFQCLAVWSSGWVYEFGMGFWGPTGHDHIWHSALNNQISNGLPVGNPILSDTILTNYHYFFNLLVGATNATFQLNDLDLLFRFYPTVFSILLGIGFFALAQKLFDRFYLSILTVYFSYFGSSFGWIVDYLRTRTLGGESNFWINQPVSFNLNPPFAISLAVMIAVILLLDKLNSKSIKVLLLFVALAGSLIEFKVYAGLLVIAALFILGMQRLILRQDKELMKAFIPTTLFSALMFIPQNSGSANLVVFSPFWFIHSMVDSQDRLGFAKLAEARMAYQMRGDYLKFFLSEVLAFTIFVVGNLGTRFVGLLLLPFLFTKKIWENVTLQFILWIILISFVVPLFFIQKGTPWNTIQFSYYALYLSSIFGAVVFWWIISWLWKVNNWGVRVVGVVGLIGVLLITPISSFSTFRGGLGKVPPSRLTFGEMEGLDFLKSQDNGVVLTHPYEKTMRERFEAPYPLLAYETSSYVSAFSNKQTFLEDEIQMEIMQLDYQNRLVGETEFFRGRDASWSSQFLRDNHIRYIYLPTVYGITLNEQELNITKIFENSQVRIFRVN